MSSRQNHSFSLSSSAEVQIALTGLTADFDCMIIGTAYCTNRGRTRDDSWSGTLPAGIHAVAVYPYDNGTSGNYTLTVTADIPASTWSPAPPPASTSPPAASTTLVSTSETAVSSSRTYSFDLASRSEVWVSLTGLTADFDCRVNSSFCSTNWGTADDSWSGTLPAGSHTVTVYPYNGASGDFTLTVTAASTATSPSSPPPSAPPSNGPTRVTPGPTYSCPAGRSWNAAVASCEPDGGTGSSPNRRGVNVSTPETYRIRLPSRATVSVNLRGMTVNFDCTVSGNDCTNRGGTSNDSWSGTLSAGDHDVVVYPVGGVTGNYALGMSVSPVGGGTTTRTTTLVAVSETGVSSQQSYGFTLSRPADVSVALTGPTIDFDCRVGSDACTNHGSTSDDYWSGRLGAGSHVVDVYPFESGPGSYSLAVTATETLNHVSRAASGEPVVVLCLVNQAGEILICEDIVFNDEITVTDGDSGSGSGSGSSNPLPPPGGGQTGEEDPDPGPPGGGGGATPLPPVVALDDLATEIDRCRGKNFWEDDRVGTNHSDAPDANTRRPKHNGIDVQTSADSVFSAAMDGYLTYYDGVKDGNGCGFQAAIMGLNRETRVVYCHLDPDDRVPQGRVNRGDKIGSYGPTGNSKGPHLHLIHRRVADRKVLDPIETLLGGKEALEASGVTFNHASDPPRCGS